LEKARTQNTDSSGLGLSISKWIVEAHKGVIEVESDEGRGTRITITLPLRQALL
jgi:signal transduction histidine kinase